MLEYLNILGFPRLYSWGTGTCLVILTGEWLRARHLRSTPGGGKSWALKNSRLHGAMRSGRVNGLEAPKMFKTCHSGDRKNASFMGSMVLYFGGLSPWRENTKVFSCLHLYKSMRYCCWDSCQELGWHSSMWANKSVGLVSIIINERADAYKRIGHTKCWFQRCCSFRWLQTKSPPLF